MSDERNREAASSELDDAPFHPGERALQAPLGLAARMDAIGRKVIRPFMPEEHRDFFARLPMVFVGSVDAAGRPWAWVIAGDPGFIGSPDPRTLVVGALPATDDPLAAALVPGAAIGLLGIELSTRRRNRMNGRVGSIDANGFSVAVDQSFGNCPKYIQARALARRGGTDGPAPRAVATPEGEMLSARAAAIVAGADTCFVASASGGGVEGRAGGADVSHRGGPPGFVRQLQRSGRTELVLPDYQGNAFFNTLGNIAINPVAGLLFIDFATGTTLSVTGTADLLVAPASVRELTGAERLLRVRVESGVLIEAALDFTWTAPQPSPWLPEGF